MRVRTVTYARLANLGNYENERLEVAADVAETDNPSVVVTQLARFVADQLNALMVERSRAGYGPEESEESEPADRDYQSTRPEPPSEN